MDGWMDARNMVEQQNQDDTHGSTLRQWHGSMPHGIGMVSHHITSHHITSHHIIA